MSDLVGAQASLVFEVLDTDTALSVGSGSLPVLATPRLLAWLEAATVAALEPRLPSGHTSVGVQIELEHLAPSPIGVHVTTVATVTGVDDRRVRFEVVARHGDGTLLARGRITRSLVDRDRFLARLR